LKIEYEFRLSFAAAGAAATRPQPGSQPRSTTFGEKRLRLLKKHAGAGEDPPADTPVRKIQPIHIKANHFREIGFVCSKSEPLLDRAQFRPIPPNRAQPIASAASTQIALHPPQGV
jgi:hypothetical protein